MFLPPAPPPPPAPSSAPLAAPPVVLALPFAPNDVGELDAASFLASGDPVEEVIRWQFTVRRGEGAAVGDNGHGLHLVTKATPQAALELEDDVRRVCAKFEARGQLAGLDVTATVSEDGTATGTITASATNVIAQRAALISIGT